MTASKPGTFPYFCSIHPRMIGKVVVVPTLATGIAAWQWQLAGQKLKGLLLLHLVLGFTSSLLICWVGWIHFW